MKFYNCPNCGASIPDKGDKIIKHKAFCKSDEDHFAPDSFFTESPIDSPSELMAVDINKIPQGVTVQKNPGGETKITYKTPGTPLWWLLLIVFVPLALLLLPNISRHHINDSFVISGIAILFFVLDLCFNRLGKWELVLNNGRGTFFCGIVKFGDIQTFKYNKNSSVSTFVAKPIPGFNLPVGGFLSRKNLLVRLFGLSSIPNISIAVTTDGKQFAFGNTLTINLDILQFMAATLLREIHEAT